MAIKEKEVWVKWNPSNRKFYESKGYLFTNYKDEFVVKTKDLSNGSKSKVTKVCDICHSNVPNAMYKDIIYELNNKGLNKCKSCGRIKIKKAVKKPTKKVVKLNLQKISRKVSKENCLNSTHPHVANLLKYKEDGYNVTYGSKQKKIFKCNLCSHEQIKAVYKVSQRGFSCSRCSDGISYPEKFMMSVLDQLNVKYSTQHIFRWAKNKKYDFYMPSLNCIIEIHGEQHYVQSRYTGDRVRSLKEEQENDFIKEKLAKENKINIYIVIDCRNSEIEWIKNNIVESKLNNYLNLSNVDWIKCNEFACNSLVKEVCKLWNTNEYTTSRIATDLDLGSSTILRYLKQGVKLGWCDYTPEKSRLISYKFNGVINSKKKVLQISKNNEKIKEWDSIIEAGRALDISSSHISGVCRGKRKTTGGFKWMYKEDYDKLHNAIKVNI